MSVSYEEQIMSKDILGYPPVLAADIRSRDVFRPIAHERKDLMGYNFGYLLVDLFSRLVLVQSRKNDNILFPQHSPYYIRIARFMPRVELVQKHNFSARRLYIRGNNGKVCDVISVYRSMMKLCDKQFILNRRKFVSGITSQTGDIYFSFE